MSTEKNNSYVIQNKRENQLQFLRFLAFLNVFIYHAESWVVFKYPVSHCASSAVSFFFMLSGLVVGYTYSERKIDLNVKEIGKFMLKRIAKFYPLYLGTVLFTVIFSGIPHLFMQMDWVGLRNSLSQLAKSLLMIQSWFQNGYYQYNGVGWFLSSMMFLYFLTLPVMYVLNKIACNSRRQIILPVLLAGSLFATVGYCYLTQQLNMDYWHYIFPPARMGEYTIGMVLGMILHIGKPYVKKINSIKCIFTLLEIAVLAYWIHSLNSPGNYWRNYIVSWLIPNMLVLTVYTIGAGWISNVFKKTPFVYLGNISFECYLLHQIIINFYASRNSTVNMSIDGKVISFIFCLVITLLLAAILERVRFYSEKHRIVKVR